MRFLATALLLALWCSQSEAAPVGVACARPDDTMRPCAAATVPRHDARMRREDATPLPGRGTVVAHPGGCPARAFCGCGASVRVFGHPVRELYLSSNWLIRFPRAAPGPGMVAARRGHVFVLERHVSGDIWLAYDANSGGHQTRVHERSVAGFAIVNPHG